MKIRRIVVSIISIVIFIALVVDCMNIRWSRIYYDLEGFAFVFFGAIALACNKGPNSIRAFLHYFSRASLFTGVLCTLMTGINTFYLVDLTKAINDGSFGRKFAYVFITMFYGLCIYAIADGLSTDQEDNGSIK